MNIMLIIKIVVVFVITSVIPFITAIVNGIKKKKTATNETEKEKAKMDLFEHTLSFIQDAEKLFKNVNNIMKAQGTPVGDLKKDNVITKLQQYAIEKGYSFDVEFWSGKIDEIISMTKNVNVK